MKAITVVGIDPGLERVGYGVLVRDAPNPGAPNPGAAAAPSAPAYGCIETARGLPAAERIREVYDAVSAVLDEHRPDCVAVEQVFFTRNITSALAVSEVRGVILLAAGQRGIPVAEYTPNQIKQAVTGSGRAGKRQVQEMMRRLLRLDEIPRPDDAADGLAVALCHMNMQRFP
ncbi:crossover junction endodeoxyribonuclease RuvC [Methanoculleus receptaculi]|uniref:Crossover junction endodeoxyribonuclease RuvC n=1 Tax=Methanoculleus receptaculi TaxID=394967 RepID=A0AAX4FSK1_9EURY|nr:crossover junction endodeoxyribonuclease RuvC [Methanoculleus receptaculi]WOX56745.1 crossover junction endodeoxyribonuclease RuvC [Methanoculleus receptaculi]